MKLYRLFYTEEGSGRLCFHDLTADSDKDAVQRARDMKLRVQCEVWDRQRRIAIIPKHSGD